MNNDALFGFSYAAPQICGPGPGCGPGTYLQSGYQFTSHLDKTLQAPYFYQPGSGPYESSGQTSLRTGDFCHTTVDATDDLTLWTTEAFAGTALGTVNCGLNCHQTVYGWESSFATLRPPGVLGLTPFSIPFVS